MDSGVEFTERLDSVERQGDGTQATVGLSSLLAFFWRP